MKKEMIRKLITTAMVGVFVINGFTVTKVDAVTDDNNRVEVSIPNLNPTPKNLEFKGGKLTLTSTVNIKGADVADADAVRILTEFLSENNITINETYSKDSTTLIVGEVGDEIAEMDSAKKRLGTMDTGLLKAEGYVLATDADDSEGGTILIEGKDNDGTFYGVKTLTQLAVKTEEGLTTAEVVISDEPTMKSRGIVEGFYGNPWTHQDRLNQIEFYGENKMNTYIYAPKDDPYHRDRWREPYPQSEMVRMGELIKTADKNKVDFVFAISPGGDIKFDGEAGEADFQALMGKCESLYAMGVRSFAIYYDDINDKSAIKQATLLNRFNAEFVKVKGDVKPLITVPTEYDTGAMVSGGQAKAYTRDFAATIDKDIEVMWTGTGVVPEGISVADAQLVNGIYGKKLAVWWNYPVTDYMKSKLALGPIYKLDKGLSEEIDFFTMNPMEHSELSRITLATGADYSWNTEKYDYDESWNKSIEMIFGDLSPEMKTFANHSTRMDGGWATSGRADAPEVRAIMDSLWSKLVNNEAATVEIEALYTEFDNMIKAADKLKAELPSGVLEECSGNLDKLKLLGENDKMALDMMMEQKAGNKVEADALRNQINMNMAALTRGSKVSEKTALAFINEALTYDPYIVNPTSIKVTASSEEIVGENAPASFISDNKTGTFWHSKWSGENVPTGGHWINLELENETTINKVRYVPRQDASLNGTITSYKLYVSSDGINYNQIKEGSLAANNSYKFIEFEPVKAKFLKLEVVNSMSDASGKEGQFATGAELNLYKIIDENPLEIIVSKVNSLKIDNVTSTTIDLNWESSNDIEGLVEYVIYKDGKKLETVSAKDTDYQMTGLKANTIYGIKITAKYSNDKESKPVSVNIRTKKK